MVHQPPGGSPGGADESPASLSDDARINGRVTHTATCAHCKQGIVRMPAGHWRLAVEDHTIDRIHCRATKLKHHRPPCDNEGRAIMRRVSPPWSGGSEPDLRAGELQ